MALPRRLQFVIVVFPDHTHLHFLFSFIIYLCRCHYTTTQLPIVFSNIFQTCADPEGGQGVRTPCKKIIKYKNIGILGHVWYLIVSIPDLCTLTYSKQYWSGSPNITKLPMFQFSKLKWLVIISTPAKRHTNGTMKVVENLIKNFMMKYSFI